MADKNKLKQVRLERRRNHIRKKVFGTPQRPRLAVYRSSKHIYAQLIDDMSGRTVVSATSTSKETRGELKHGANVKAAELIGKTIAERAVAAGIKEVAFDRGGRMYHGRIKALADAARKAGLKF
ncbi:MAG: 50S ribosomal protein L18 [Bacillota bacterium]